MMNEEWKAIKGFDGYFINKLGEVKSARTYKGTKEKILKSHKNQQGYLVYTLMRFGKPYLKPLHRLLMENFKPNKCNLPCINHIDGDILNNSLDNLEWCTYSHNNKEAYKLGLKQPAWSGKFGKEHPNSKSVNQYSLDGEFIKQWNCISTIERELGISVNSICNCCSGKSKKAGNYIWRYVNE